MKKRTTFLTTLTFFLIIITVISCRIVDIRTIEVKENYDYNKGMKILSEMSKAHSLKTWDTINTYSVHVTDEFFGLLGKFGNPFPNNKAAFDFTLIPKTFTSRAIFTDDKWKDIIWGIQSWKTYSNKGNTKSEFHAENDKLIEFWLPTYQYFFEVQLRVFEADKISYAGEREYNGKLYDLVFASWKSDKPQKDIDQYILWVERETKLLKRIQYTVRDQYRWIHATLFYNEYKNIGGLLIPKKMRISLMSSNEDKIIHEINLTNIRLNEKEKMDLLLDPKLGTTGKK